MKSIYLSLLASSLLVGSSAQGACTCPSAMLGAGLASAFIVNALDKRIIQPNVYGLLFSSCAYMGLDVFKNDCGAESARNKAIAMAVGYVIGMPVGKYINAKVRHWWNKV